MSKATSQKSLDNWTKEDWGTKSGKNSTQGKNASGERYLPRQTQTHPCLLYTSPSPRDRTRSRMPSSA